MPKSVLEEILADQITFAALPAPQREYRFAALSVGLGPGIRVRLALAGLRDWRFDFAWPDRKLAIEVEGGIWAEGRHTRARGFTDDCIKYNEAQLLGWRILRVTAKMVRSGEALRLIERASSPIKIKKGVTDV